jgi:predicted MFS family arabinose efflux permease
VLGHEENWPAWTWVMLAASVAVTAGFVLVQRRTAARGGSPLIHPEVLRSPGLPSAVTSIFLVMVGVGGIFLALTLHLQSGLGHGPLASGLLVAPMALAFGVSGLYWRRLPERLHPVLPVLALAVVAVAYAAFAAEVRDGRPVGVVLLALEVVIGLASGVAYGPLMAAALRHVAPRYAADASGVVVTLVQLGQVVGVASLGSLFLGAVTRPGAAATGHGLELVAAVVAALSVAAGVSAGLVLRRRPVAVPVPVPSGSA